MTITPRLVAKYEIPDPQNTTIAFGPSGPVPRAHVRGADRLRLFELREQAEPIAEFPVPAPGWRHWVAPDLSFAVFPDREAYVAVARDGTRLWEQPYGGWDAHSWGYVDFSTSGGEPRVWLRLPSGLVDSTLLLALDAKGTVLARNLLPYGGYGCFVGLNRDEHGELTGLTVTCEGEPKKRYRARQEAGRIIVGQPMTTHQLPDGRQLLDSDPGSTRCMTADRRGQDVSWHRLPSYEVTATIKLSDFPAPGTGDCAVHNDPWISGWGGFVDAGTALVGLGNSYDEAAVLMFGEDRWEEYSHWLADPATGTLHGRIEYPMRDVDNVTVLGDGTWITKDWDTLYRWHV